MVCFSDTLLGSLPQYTHIEADYRIVGHILAAIQEGYTSTMVRANDTDILIGLLGFLPLFLEKNKDFILQVNFGAGKSQCMLHINKMSERHGLEHCRGLLFFHAFTGCDYTAYFYDIGKRRWYDVFMAEQELYSDVFNQLMNNEHL